jgi:hypothetical protein
MNVCNNKGCLNKVDKRGEFCSECKNILRIEGLM